MAGSPSPTSTWPWRAWLMLPVSITAILLRVIFKLKLADKGELAGLMDEAAYKAFAA